MWEGQDFGHRISGYQRYPTGFTGLEATHIAWVSGVSPSSYQRYSANISRKADVGGELRSDPRHRLGSIWSPVGQGR